MNLTDEERDLVVSTLLGEAVVYDYNGEAADAARLRSAAKKLLKKPLEREDLTN